jgi:hypothetical protein
MPKKPQPEIQSCATCRCFVAEPKDELGLCKRYPPVVVVIEDDPVSTFPAVERDEICGEYAIRLAS